MYEDFRILTIHGTKDRPDKRKKGKIICYKAKFLTLPIASRNGIADDKTGDNL